MKLAILATHPIQYQVPLFRALDREPDLEPRVYFCARDGLDAYHDRGFGRRIQWDVPLLDGYSHEFLPNRSRAPNASTFLGVVNPAIRDRLREERPDALLVQGWSRTTEWLAIHAARRQGIPILLRGESNLLAQPPAWKAPLKTAVLTRLFRRIDAFLAIGTHNAAFYEHYGVPRERILLSPYAVDNEAFMRQGDALREKREELRRTLGVADDRPVFLFTGKLIPAKAPLDLLRAFEKLSAKHRATLVFVGDGELRGQLEEYARSRDLDVRFEGFRNQSELAPYYVAADVFCLPSTFERWGLVVNEAMCFGLPVVVSDAVGAATDLVTDGENGHVHPAGDVEALAAKLGALLDAETRRAMGKRSRDRISRWSYREDVDSIRTAMQRVARKGGKA